MCSFWRSGNVNFLTSFLSFFSAAIHQTIHTIKGELWCTCACMWIHTHTHTLYKLLPRWILNLVWQLFPQVFALLLFLLSTNPLEKRGKIIHLIMLPLPPPITTGCCLMHTISFSWLSFSAYNNRAAGKARKSTTKGSFFLEFPPSFPAGKCGKDKMIMTRRICSRWCSRATLTVPWISMW